MSADATYDIFIAYADDDRVQGEQLFDALAEILPRERVYMASRCLKPGQRWDTEVARAQRASRMTAILLSSHTAAAFYECNEIVSAIALSRRGRQAVVPVNLEATTTHIPWTLLIIQRLDWRASGGAQGVARHLVACLAGIQAPIRGVASWAEVFETKGLPGQAFAAELLTQPVLLERNQGRTTVRIDRRGVHDAVYTTGGKTCLCKKLLTGDVAKWAENKDGEIHRFLLSRRDDEVLRVDLHQFPLRWASGGVLSVVQIDGSSERWTPFFFRDIPPVGWNIALGASEGKDELNDPWRFLLREFLEETLVLPGPPGTPGIHDCRMFTVGEYYGDHWVERARAMEFAKEHVALRNFCDGLGLQMGPGRERPIFCTEHPTTTDVEIIGCDDQPPTRWHNLLVCLNLMELGIEVIKILSYRLSQADYLLDGEILKGAGPEGKPALVRMPVALISHRYLRRAFGTRDFAPRLEYAVLTDPDGVSVQAEQPSVRPDTAPRPNEIKIFHWDAVRRRDLVNDTKRRTPGSVPLGATELRRHEKWLRNFEQHFFYTDGSASGENPFPLFTATSAKVMSYYFASLRPQ
jgi:hypothetical protein